MSNYNGRGEIYPWQIQAWQSLWATKQKQRLPHALLILGVDGLGKERLAQAFAHSMLCRHPNHEGYTCGQCHACHLVQANSHPDLVIVAAEQPGQIIKVDQIRDVVQFVNETSMQGGFRVIIVKSAHNMNHNAANSLLKTLEEPPPNTLFILLSQYSQRLKATITSRCQKIVLHKPEYEIALEWMRSQLSDLQLTDSQLFSAETLHVALHMAAGAPVKALTMLTDDTMTQRQAIYQGLMTLGQGQADPLKLAAEWHEQDLLQIFSFLFYWLQDLLKLQMVAGVTNIINTDYNDFLKQLTLKITKENVLSYLTYVQERYAMILNSLNLNRQLLLEELLIRYCHASML